MTEEQFEALMGALFDIKAEVRDLRNDLRRAAEVASGDKAAKARGLRRVL